MDTMIRFEILKLNTSEVWFYHQEFSKDSELYNQFQMSEDPTTLGFVFSHIYIEPEEIIIEENE